MGEYLIGLDTDIFLWINSWNALFWDIAMKMASGKLIWAGMYAAILLALYKAYGWRSALVITVMAALAVTAADQVTASLLRPIFERMRPSNPDNPISSMVHIVDGYRSGRYGFPSCHAANTFAMASLMSFVFFRWRFTLFIIFWALLNCYSRVYLGVHYPGDLLAGTMIGCICGTGAYFLGKLCISLWKGCSPVGATDRVRTGVLNTWHFKYRPVDIVILVGVMTIIYILACAASILI